MSCLAVPLSIVIVVAWLGLTTALALALADASVRVPRGPHAVRLLGARRFAALARRLAARRAAACPMLAVAVLAGESARHGRVRRTLRTILGQCTTTICPPADPCAVVLVRTVERDGRPLRGCVERLTFPDGTRRTVISLPAEERGQALSLDDLAARLAAYYWAVVDAERTVVLAEALPPRAAPAVRPAAGPTAPPLATLTGLPTGAVGPAPYEFGPRP